MINIHELETRLNADRSLRAELMRNPVEVLRREGIELSERKAADLTHQMAQITQRPSDVAGSSIAAGGLAPSDVNVNVSQTVHF